MSNIISIENLVKQYLGDQTLVVPVSFDVVEVVGPDATSFLQGQLSQDLAKMSDQSCKQSLLLQPQGKLVALMRVFKVNTESYLLVVESGVGEAVAQRLNRFKLRVDAEIKVGERSGFAFRWAKSQDKLAPAVEGIVVEQFCEGVTGFDVLDIERDQLPEEIQISDHSDLIALRILCGQPMMNYELNESIIPAAAGIVDASVSFTKGCYVGQELIARIDSRGNNTPQNLIQIQQIENVETLAEGLKVFSGSDLKITIDGVEVGNVTSCVYDNTESSYLIALGYLKRGVEAGAAQVDIDGRSIEVNILRLLDKVVS